MQNKSNICTYYFWGQGKVASTRKGCKYTVTALRLDYRGTISLSRAQERDRHLAKANQNTATTRPACWYKHTAMARCFVPAVQSLSRAQERDHTCGNKSWCRRGTPVLLLDRFHWRQFICYSKIFNYSFFFFYSWRKLKNTSKTYWGWLTEVVTIYKDIRTCVWL